MVFYMDVHTMLVSSHGLWLIFDVPVEYVLLYVVASGAVD